MEIEGKSYISSKRASQETGYAQDYIGQLSRKALIDARRIGGLWYVSIESLQAYKKKADEFKPDPPVRSENQETGTLVFFDGKEYLSAARAAEQTGYTQDYVGQLARSGTIFSRQVGNRWYVERDAIMAHKNEKDSLLAAVQAQSVGLARRATSTKTPPEYLSNTSHFGSLPLMTYFGDEGDLIPAVHKDAVHVNDKDDVKGKRPASNIVPIKRIHEKPRTVFPGSLGNRRVLSGLSAQKETGMPLLLTLVATIVVVLSVGYASVLRQNSAYAIGNLKSTEMAAMAAKADAALSWAGDLLEPLLAHELIFERQTK